MNYLFSQHILHRGTHATCSGLQCCNTQWLSGLSAAPAQLMATCTLCRVPCAGVSASQPYPPCLLDLKSQNVLLADDYLDPGQDATLSAANACRLRALIGDFGCVGVLLACPFALVA